MGKYEHLLNAFTQCVRRIVAHQPVEEIGGCPIGMAKGDAHCPDDCVFCWQQYLVNHEFVVHHRPPLMPR